jgi:branched-chain amino acid transport system permease protein
MLEILVFSLIIGLGYSLMASGFNLLLSVGRIINLAYGAHVVLVAYIYSTLAQSLQPGLAALIALAINCHRNGWLERSGGFEEK